MRKIFGFALVSAMAVSITACGGDTKETTAAETTVAATEETTVEETTVADTEEETEAETEETETEAAGDEAGAAGVTLGDALLADFEELVEANADATLQELADGILKNEMILFSGVTMEVEEGLLNGFSIEEIKGFDSGMMFAPMIGSIPFVGYVFDTADADAAAALVETLEASANPAWNICVEADQTVVSAKDDKVFFVMCPETIEE